MLPYRALGEVGVVSDGVPLPLHGENQRRLLAVLVARAGQAVTVDVLADALWPQITTARTRGSVQTVVSRLRRSLGDRRSDIVTTADGYRLAAGPDELDTARFEDLVARARVAEPPAAVQLLEEALALWRGPAFGALSDLEPVRLAALRLDELRLVAAEDRIELLLELHRFAEALPELEVLVAGEPLRERLRGQLMRALHATGRQADALDVYGSYRDLLGEDLGLDPSAELQALHAAILRDEVAVAVPAPTGPVLSGRPAGSGDDGDAHHLERQAWRAMWACDHDRALADRQQAYVRLVRDHDRAGAARVAIWLGVNAAIRLRNAVAFGWLGRAERLLRDLPPGPSHALLAGLGAMVAVLQGDLDTAIMRAETAQIVGEKVDDPDGWALGRVIEGWAWVRSGQRGSGLALIDEAMASAVAGELSPYVTGLVYCRTLCACLDLMDYERAAQWTDEIDESQASGGSGGLPGDCRTHRLTILFVTGQWERCEEQSRIAAEETAAFDMTHLGLVHAVMGELLLRRGDLEGADQRLTTAQELGTSPHPARALLLLAQGQTRAAAQEITDQLGDATHDPLVRARLLPAAVETALARGDVDAAASAAHDLQAIAKSFGTSTLHAEALTARGRTLLAQGEPGRAIRALRASFRRWRAIGSDYRVATTRMYLSEALSVAGRHAEAASEARAAHAALERVGAVPDAQRAARLTDAASERRG